MRSTKEQIEIVRKAFEELSKIKDSISTDHRGKPWSPKLTQPKAEWLILAHACENIKEYLYLTRKVRLNTSNVCTYTCIAHREQNCDICRNSTGDTP